MQMDEFSHEGHGSQIDLEGYRSCGNEWCGDLILKEIAERTKGFCPPCFRKLTGATIGEVEIRNRGQRMVTPVRMNTKLSKNKGDRHTSKRAHKANVRAMRRLAMLFPDLYDVLRAEERARDGLDPWPIETVIQAGGATFDEAIGFSRLLLALEDAGIDTED